MSVNFGTNIDSNGLISNLKNLLVGFKNNLETNASSMSAKIETCFNNWSVNENNFKDNLYKITPNIDYAKFGADISSIKIFCSSIAKGIAKKNEEEKERIAIENHPLAKRDIPLDFDNFANMSKTEIKSALEERLSMMGLSSDLNSKAKQCIVGGKAVTTDSAKPYIEILSDAVYEHANTLEKSEPTDTKEQKQQEENKNSPEQQRQQETPEENSIFTPEQQKNIEKYKMDVKDVEEYEQTMQELANLGLLTDDEKTKQENESEQENQGKSWTDYLSPEEKEQYEIDKGLYDLREITSKEEYLNTLEDLRKRGLIQENALSINSSNDSNT